MSSVFIENEWSQLEEVVVGIPGELFVGPASSIDLDRAVRWQLRLINRLLAPFESWRMPGFTVRRYERELSGFVAALQARDIRVVRPDTVRSEPEDAPQLYPRDQLAVIGDTVIRCRVVYGERQKHGLDRLCSELRGSGVRVLEVPRSGNAVLQGGDIAVDLPRVYVGLGKHATNKEGIDWLAEQFPDLDIIPVPIVSGTVLHLDTALTVIGPKLGIIHRPSLGKLPAPLASYEWIEVDDTTQRQLGTNVLQLGPKTIVIQKRHRALHEALAKKGFEVIALPFWWHASASEGAFHCATAPLVRARQSPANRRA